jgi:lysozyme family protein
MSFVLDKEIFNKAINFTFQAEGFLSNDKDDPGGLTKFGISQKQHPNIDVKNLTLEDAKEIYYRDYWKKIKCDMICSINPKIAIIVFDTHVNTGRGIKLLQQTIKQFPTSPFNQISIDGIYGNQTHTLLKDLNQIAPNYIIYNYLINRIFYYNYISRKNPKLKKFLSGWINRVTRLRDYVLNL